MTRREQYRALQASVPGLDALYTAIGDRLARMYQPDSRVLIVGGGGGREIELLAQRGSRVHLTVLDPSPSNLSEAKALAKDVAFQGEITFVEGSHERLPDLGAFDGATLLNVLHMIQNTREELDLLTAVRSRLAPGGSLILADISFESGARVDDMLAQYETHARAIGTAEDLIALEQKSVLARRTRSQTALFRSLHSARFAVSDQIGTALWYRAVACRAIPTS